MKKNRKLKLTKIAVSMLTVFVLAASFSNTASALSVFDLEPKVEATNLTAKSAIVLNQVTGQVLYETTSETLRAPASLVKLVTALVVLDTKPDWRRICYIEEQDRVGGSSITVSSQGRVGYRMGDLFRAMLIPSANDAAESIARCTGLSRADFLSRMQSKALEQNALTAKFVDVSGMSQENQMSALGVARLSNAAFSTEFVRSVTRTQSYKLCTINGACRYVKNTNSLLADKELTTIAGKTGTLDGAINFAGSFRDSRGHYFIVVVLGAESKQERFAEAKELVKFASEKSFWQDLFSVK